MHQKANKSTHSRKKEAVEITNLGIIAVVISIGAVMCYEFVARVIGRLIGEQPGVTLSSWEASILGKSALLLFVTVVGLVVLCHVFLRMIHIVKSRGVTKSPHTQK